MYSTFGLWGARLNLKPTAPNETSESSPQDKPDALDAKKFAEFHIKRYNDPKFQQILNTSLLNLYKSHHEQNSLPDDKKAYELIVACAKSDKTPWPIVIEPSFKKISKTSSVDALEIAKVWLKNIPQELIPINIDYIGVAYHHLYHQKNKLAYQFAQECLRLSRKNRELCIEKIFSSDTRKIQAAFQHFIEQKECFSAYKIAKFCIGFAFNLEIKKLLKNALTKLQNCSQEHQNLSKESKKFIIACSKSEKTLWPIALKNSYQTILAQNSSLALQIAKIWVNSIPEYLVKNNDKHIQQVFLSLERKDLEFSYRFVRTCVFLKRKKRDVCIKAIYLSSPTKIYSTFHHFIDKKDYYTAYKFACIIAKFAYRDAFKGFSLKAFQSFSELNSSPDFRVNFSLHCTKHLRNKHNQEPIECNRQVVERAFKVFLKEKPQWALNLAIAEFDQFKTFSKEVFMSKYKRLLTVDPMLAHQFARRLVICKKTAIRENFKEIFKALLEKKPELSIQLLEEYLYYQSETENIFYAYNTLIEKNFKTEAASIALKCKEIHRVIYEFHQLTSEEFLQSHLFPSNINFFINHDKFKTIFNEFLKENKTLAALRLAIVWLYFAKTHPKPEKNEIARSLFEGLMSVDINSAFEFATQFDKNATFEMAFNNFLFTNPQLAFNLALVWVQNRQIKKTKPIFEAFLKMGHLSKNSATGNNFAEQFAEKFAKEIAFEIAEECSLETRPNHSFERNFEKFLPTNHLISFHLAVLWLKKKHFNTLHIFRSLLKIDPSLAHQFAEEIRQVDDLIKVINLSLESHPQISLSLAISFFDNTQEKIIYIESLVSIFNNLLKKNVDLAFSFSMYVLNANLKNIIDLNNLNCPAMLKIHMFIELLRKNKKLSFQFLNAWVKIKSEIPLIEHLCSEFENKAKSLNNDAAENFDLLIKKIKAKIEAETQKSTEIPFSRYSRLKHR